MADKIKSDKLRTFCKEIFKKVGLNEGESFIIADSLVFANLRGIDSHGVIRFPFYVKRLVEGGSNAQPELSIIKEKSAYSLIDGNNGMGQVIGIRAAELAIEKAKKEGISFIGVRGSSHFGAASYYSTRIAQENMIGFSTTNSTQTMAAYGGGEKVLGNNPISIAVPYKEDKPLVLDISMSQVSGGKIKVYAKEDKKIPKDWGLDKFGRETDDPNEVLDEGTYLPFGKHKGYGLAVMMEVLNGVLTGADMLSQNFSWWRNPEKPLNLGHCFIAININDFVGMEEFNERIGLLVDEIKDSSLAEGFNRIYMPGEIELEVEEKRKEGIPISQSIWDDLKDLSNTYNVPLTS